MFFMKDSHEAGLDEVLPCHPGQDELRKIVVEIASDLTADVVPAATSRD